MPLHVSGSNVSEELARVGDMTLATKAVYGDHSSLMIATRPPGYHSRPHTHESEQLNWLHLGEVWIFVEEQAFQLRSGDFMRVPAGAVHWAWNKSAEPCVMIEVHSPGMQHDPMVREVAVGLYDDHEIPAPRAQPSNRFLTEDSAFDPTVAEKQAE